MKRKWSDRVEVGRDRGLTIRQLIAGVAWTQGLIGLAIRPVWVRRMFLMSLCVVVPAVVHACTRLELVSIFGIGYLMIFIVVIVFPIWASQLSSPILRALINPEGQTGERKIVRPSQPSSYQQRWIDFETEATPSDDWYRDSAARVNDHRGDRDNDDELPDATAINPATGWTMVGGIGGVDTHGNPYGCDFEYRASHDDHHHSEDCSPFSNSHGWD